MSPGEHSPFSGARLDSAAGAAALSAARAAIEAWWLQHRDSLSPEHREFFRHFVEQAELCLRLAAEAAIREKTQGVVDAGARPPDRARRGGDGVESAGWVDLVQGWHRAAAAVVGAAPGPAPSQDAEDTVHRCWHDYREALSEYLAILRSVSQQTLNDAAEALRDERTAGEEQPLRRQYERLVEKGEARYLEVANSEHYARLQARLVNSLLRLKRAQQLAPPRR